MKTKTDQFESKWFVRAIGVFCGAFIGIAVAALCISFLDAPTTLQAVTTITVGALSGTVIGFFFPTLAELILRVVSDMVK